MARTAFNSSRGLALSRQDIETSFVPRVQEIEIYLKFKIKHFA